MKAVRTIEEAVTAVIASLDTYRKIPGSLEAVVAVLYEAYPKHAVDAEVERQVGKDGMEAEA